MELAARQINVDVLISGHTHTCKVYENNNVFFVNPGSATGAFSLIEKFFFAKIFVLIILF